jgi:hypothetical protein
MWPSTTVIREEGPERMPPLEATAYAAPLRDAPAAARRPPRGPAGPDGVGPHALGLALRAPARPSLGRSVGFVCGRRRGGAGRGPRAAVFVYLGRSSASCSPRSSCRAGRAAKIAGGLLIVGGVYAGTLAERPEAPEARSRPAPGNPSPDGVLERGAPPSPRPTRPAPRCRISPASGGDVRPEVPLHDREGRRRLLLVRPGHRDAPLARRNGAFVFGR